MRKVSVEAEIEIEVPVRVKVEFLIRADDDANIDHVLSNWNNGQRSTKADIENVTVENVVTIGEKFLNEGLDVIADGIAGNTEDLFNSTTNKRGIILSARVTDSW